MNGLLMSNLGRLVTMDPGLGTLTGAQLYIEGGRVTWIGATGDEPPGSSERVVDRLDCQGRAVLPGLVDCHTHLVFGGDRREEFGLRSSGVSYEEIARRGGGIRSTVTATRAASEEHLLRTGLARLDRMLARGVTCVEIKSGYGLDLETELKMLRVARRLGELHPITVKTTFLGAHTVPAEHAAEPDRYVRQVSEEMIPAVAETGLADFCDVFCERTAFSVEQSRRILEAGLAAGLTPKLHSEQLHRTGGTELGVSLGAASVDHLEQANDDDVAALAGGRTVGVLLPGATLYLGMSRWAPARALIDAGVTVALSTDCNPGSCMCDDLPLMTTLACTRLGMSPAESLRAITWGAACALGEEGRRGALTVGRAGDCVVLDTDHEEEWPYRFGRIDPLAVVAGGEIVLGPGRDVTPVL